MSRKAIMFEHDAEGLRVMTAPILAIASVRLLAMVDAELLPAMSVSQGVLTITATNGTWRYRVGAKRNGTVELDLIDAI